MNFAVGLGELALACLAVAGHASFVVHHGLHRGLLRYNRFAALDLNTQEAMFFLATLLIAWPVAVLLCDATFRLFPRLGPPLAPRLAARYRFWLPCLAIGATLAAELCALLVLEHAQLTDDERVYLFQAQAMLQGHLTAPRPGPFDQFPFTFMLPVGQDRWGAIYPPGQAALLALGLRLGHAHLSQALCAGAIVAATMRLGKQLWNAEVAIVAGLLTALSPALLFSAASFHNSVPTALFGLLAISSAHGLANRFRKRDGLALGASMGAMLLVRPFDAVVLSVPISLYLLWRLFRANETTVGARVWAALATLPGGAAAIFVLLLSNRAITGSPWISPYAVFHKRWPDSHAFGFGPGPFGVTHTPLLAFSKFVVALVRTNQWFFGFPAALVPLGWAVLRLGAGLDKQAWLLFSLVACQYLGYFFYVLSPVHDLGSIYHLLSMPLLALLMARMVGVLGDRLQRISERARRIPIRLVAMLSVAGFLTFWPVEVHQLQRLGAGIVAPVRAAEAVAKSAPVIVFYQQLRPPYPSEKYLNWVFFPPLPDPALADPVLWVVDRGPARNGAIAKRFPDRTPYRLSFLEGKPHLGAIPKGDLE